MTRIFFLLVVLLNFSFKLVFAQKEGTVTYYYIHKNLGMRQPSQLKFKNEESVLIQRQDQQVWPTPGESRSETTSPRRYNDWYFNAKSKDVIWQEILEDGTKIFARLEAEPIQWEIQDETKTILGFKVQKAIAKDHPHSGIRNKGTIEYGYAIAWFAADIPIGSGPDRFWGLPGLILELSFSERTLVYIAEKIDFGFVGEIKPNKGIEVKREQIENSKSINKKWLKNARELLNNDN